MFISIYKFFIKYLLPSVGFREYLNININKEEVYPELKLVPDVSKSIKKYEIFFSGSGLLFIYQMGVQQAMLEDLNNDYIKNNCYISGSSGGAVSSFGLFLSLYNVGDLKYWYRNLGIYISYYINYYNIFSYLNSYEMIGNHLCEAYILSKARGITSEHFKYGYNIYVSQINGDKEYYRCNEFNNSHIFTKTLLSSILIPGIISRGSIKINDNYYYDGALTSIKDIDRIDDTKRIYLYISKKMENLDEENININIMENNEDTSLFSYIEKQYYVITDSEQIFNDGYNWGKKNIKNIFKNIDNNF